MRIEYTIIPIEERKDKICNKCNTDKSVKYLLKSDNCYYCNVCILSKFTK